MTRFWNLASGSIRLKGRLPWVLVAGLLAFWPTIGAAQGLTPDPFRPYNMNYNAYVWPVAPQMDYGFNSATMRGMRGANQFQKYMDSLLSPENVSPSRGGVGVPYYRANRKYDRDFNRVYRPNEKADRDFDASREKSTDLYFKYLRATDPRERAELFRKYNRARAESDRALRANRSNPRGAPSPLTDERDAGDEGGTSNLEGRARLDAPSPLTSGRARGRTPARTGGSRAGSAFGPAPAPLGNSGAASDRGRAPTPSEVLDRAIRSERDRSRIRPRSRVLTPSPGPVEPPPPTP